MPERRVCPTCGDGYDAGALFCPRDGAPLAARPAEAGRDTHVGLQIAPGLTVERLVGIGSMARVYRAYQSGLERAVAVKVLHREHAQNPTMVARFHREGRVAGGLSHPNVIAVHGAGELPRAGGQAPEPYLVLELLDGLTLRSALAGTGGSLPLARALRVVLQASDAMGEAHARGVVHRDLKPENVMLVPVGREPDFVKVLDFGVARVGEADSSLATHAGAVLGTAQYASPESARGEPVGPPGDVYAIATMLFECLAGRPPFLGKGPVDLLIQHARGTPPDIRTFATSVPEPVARVVMRGLAKAPRDRFENARELGKALVDAVRLAGITLGERPTLLGHAGASMLPSTLVVPATEHRSHSGESSGAA